MLKSGPVTRFDEFSERYDRGWRCRTTGLTVEETNFSVTKEAEFVGNNYEGSQTPNMRRHGNQRGHAHFDQHQKGQGHRPDVPRPHAKQRDDFEAGYTPRVRPPGF